MGDAKGAELEHLLQVGKRIAAALVDRNLSPEGLAARSGVDPKTIRSAIKGRRTRQSSLYKICKALEIDPDDEIKLGTIAGEKYGSYNLEHYKEYIGSFWRTEEDLWTRKT